MDLVTEVHLKSFPSVAQRLLDASGRYATAVVLPCYARGRQDVVELRRTLEALGKQTRKPDVLLLVDDGSPEELEPATNAWPSDGLALVAWCRLGEATVSRGAHAPQRGPRGGSLRGPPAAAELGAWPRRGGGAHGQRRGAQRGVARGDACGTAREALQAQDLMSLYS